MKTAIHPMVNDAIERECADCPFTRDMVWCEVEEASCVAAQTETYIVQRGTMCPFKAFSGVYVRSK